MRDDKVCPCCGKFIGIYNRKGEHVGSELHYVTSEHYEVQSISYRVMSFVRKVCIPASKIALK